MSDKKFGQPIRTEADGTDSRVHTKIVDFTSPAGVDKQAEVSEKLVHVRAFGQDPANTKVQLKLSEQGHVNPQGDYDASTNTVPASSGLVAHDRTATPGLSHQNKRITGVTNSTVHALDVAIRDEDGTPYSLANPLPVQQVGATEGDEINNYDTSVDVASDAADNHDYTVTALKTLILKSVSCSTSGRARFEVQIETAPSSGTFTTREVKFGTASNPNAEFDFSHAPISVPAGAIVRVIRTNTDNQAQDVYSTIKGIEV